MALAFIMTFATMRVIKNMRIRSQQAETRRRERWQEKNVAYKQNRDDQKEERKEKTRLCSTFDARYIPKHGYSC